MSLIRVLQEASNLTLDDLKKAMQKDKVAALLFKKDLSLDQIQDKDAFLATVKYWLLNNQNVQSFIKLRHNVKDLDNETLSSYRKLRGKDLDENRLKWLKEFVASIFSEHRSASNGVMSAALKKELRDWLNANGRYFNLPAWAQRELMAIPSLRPTKRVLVYRGLLFSESSFKEKKKYDGTLGVGNGLKFVRSIKKGGREVDLVWDRPSSWSTSKDVASNFAQYGPASSNYTATLQWLSREAAKKHIDGQVGYVIATFAEPDDILLDTSLMGGVGGHLQHGDEGEIILKAGTYKCRVVKKYTVDQGEVSPDEDEENESSKVMREKVAAANSFDLKLPSFTDSIKYPRNIWSSDAIELMSEPSVFKKLVLNSTTTEIMNSYEKLLDWYKAHLKDLDKGHLSPTAHARDEDLTRKVAKIKSLIDSIDQNVKHANFKSTANHKGVGKASDLTPAEYRSTISAHDINTVERDIMTRGMSTKDSQFPITELANAVGVKLPGSAKLHMFGAAKQEPVINEIISAFFKTVGVDKPQDPVEAKKAMFNLMRKAHRNHYILQQLKRAKEILEDLK